MVSDLAVTIVFTQPGHCILLSGGEKQRLFLVSLSFYISWQKISYQSGTRSAMSS